jgi:hypothetical protein
MQTSQHVDRYQEHSALSLSSYLAFAIYESHKVLANHASHKTHVVLQFIICLFYSLLMNLNNLKAEAQMNLTMIKYQCQDIQIFRKSYFICFNVSLNYYIGICLSIMF